MLLETYFWKIIHNVGSRLYVVNTGRARIQEHFLSYNLRDYEIGSQ